MTWPFVPMFRSHPLCSSTPRFPPTTQSPYPVSRASRGWLTHACTSANLPQPCRAYPFAVHPYPCPRLQNIHPEPDWNPGPDQHTHTPGYCSLPTELSKTMLPHAPRSSVFVPSSSAGVAAPLSLLDSGPSRSNIYAGSGKQRHRRILAPSKTLQKLIVVRCAGLVCRFCVRAECEVVD